MIGYRALLSDPVKWFKKNSTIPMEGEVFVKAD